MTAAERASKEKELQNILATQRVENMQARMAAITQMLEIVVKEIFVKLYVTELLLMQSFKRFVMS